MRRRWSASSKHGRGAAIAKAAVAALIAIVITSGAHASGSGTRARGGGAIRAVAQADSKSAGAQAAAALLAVPTYDVKRVREGKLQVGDTVELRVTGLSLPGITAATTDLRIEPGPDSDGDLSGKGFAFAPSSVPVVEEPPAPGATSAPIEAPAATELRIKVKVLKAGKLTLPALNLLPVNVAAGEPAAALARTAPLEIEVQSAIRADDPKPKEAEGLQPAQGLPFPWPLFVALGVLAALLLGAAIYALVRWSRRPAVVAPAPIVPARPEHEVALAALAELERRGYARAGDFKAHYFGISEILKEYLGRRYGFDAPESTSHELLTWLDEHRVALPDLAAMLNRLDRVKFSDFSPSADEPGELVTEARQLVTSTRRAFEPVVPSTDKPGGPGAA